VIDAIGSGSVYETVADAVGDARSSVSDDSGRLGRR
jgi:hypothetical protein